MQTLELDATKWKTVLDFYDALLAAVGAPEWHGKSPAALVDSMIWGGINAVEPPYMVRIADLSAAPAEVRDHVQLVRDALVNARIGRKRHNGDDVEASIVIAPASDGIGPDEQASKIRSAVAAVRYEGPDPRLDATIERLRRQL